MDRGYSTLFEYCVKKLRYSEAATFLRIRAARAARAVPRVLVDLRSGALHLDAVMRLYPHLNDSNSDALLNRAAGATKREVMALVADLSVGQPAPERDVIRRLPTDQTSEILPPPERIRLAFTADDDFLIMIERLRGLMRHKFPKGGLEDLLREAVSKHLARIDPLTKKGRPGAFKAPRKSSRWIPSSVKAEVWTRDGGRCAYIASDGHRCESREFLELDHIIPWALGGRSDTPANIRLLCRPHNQRLARKRFGPRRRPA